MNIQILQLLEGAREATGLTVIIDVFRAFSTACYAFNKGTKKIIPVDNIEKAYQLKKENPEYLLIGERNEMKPHGFDFGNSPTHLLNARLNGKTIVHTTSSGTQGIAAADRADEIITGSFVNAGAVVRYIRQAEPETVSLVCMGYACSFPVDEDTLCAEYIRNELTGQPNDFNKMTAIIRKGSGKRFFEPEKQEWAPSSDFDLCMKLNIFNFILKVRKECSPGFLQKIPVNAVT
ncbi:MAG: 2-phosphosulfolactate phosphatase [Prolixibacteraceae bacterium]|jgi:2-phosphosulfolactate phosphatase|nr:2-phosphosulfolactate phosphatase [Prolixibacteraceae bacterium]MDD4756314.1 2-phosphosulfolactate phosphatase [Prolixibacteraceae bacterium]NLO01471.1 2-phosphosulfolactate phosphatase [Bacteroidales bacterium]